MFRFLTSSLTSLQFLKKALPAFLIMLILFFPHFSSAQQSQPKNILVLFSFRPTLPVASKWDWGIRSIFKAEPNLKVDINIEYLDLSRFNDSNYIKMIFSVFRHKYFGSKPDLIVAVYEPALDFLLRHQEALFPGVPIVFGGVERVFIENQGKRPDITGVYQGNSFIKTLETALNLHPNTRHIRIFVGAGMLEQSWAMAAREAYVRYEDKYDFVYVPARSIEDLQKKVAELPPNTLILYLPILKDGSDKTHVAIEVISRISKVSTAPIYGFWEVILGHGIVGGYLSSFEDQAKAVAKIGLRILKGARAADILPIDTPGLRYMFDWQQLRRWSISEDRLPPGSTVMFKESSTWEKYKGQIFFAVALIVLQALIILYLLHQRRIKRKVEQNYRTVADYTYDWEYWQNTNGKLQYVSPSCERICGYSVQELMAKPSLLEDMIVPEDRAAWVEHNCRVQEEVKSEEIQFRIQKPDGDIRWIEHACQPVFDNQGNNQGVRASNRDITIRKQSEESLKASRKEAGLLAGRLLNAQEVERARVARELHDDITQRLAVMNIEVDKLEMQNRSLPESLKEKLRQLGNNLGDLSSDIHMISRQLHPAILYDLGLVKAIETECNNFTQMRGISPTLDLDDDIKNVPKEIALCIYRILQSGLRNISKHAKASNIQVRLYKKDDTICFFLKDNGIGFDPASAKERGGIGLASMEERARLINGALSIESKPGEGTIIELKVAVTSDSIG